MRAVILAVAILLVMAAVGEADMHDQLAEQQAYCSNVDKWEESGQRYGHPDYDKKAGEVCHDD